MDTAILTVIENKLNIVLVKDDAGNYLLPGTFVHERERLADAVLRSMQEKCGITGRKPKQLQVFDDPERDDRGWVVTVAHLDLVPDMVVSTGLLTGQVTLVPVAEVLPGGSISLPYDHPQVVRVALARVASEYDSRPDPWHMLRPPFTLTELQELHFAITGKEIQRDTFRRHMEPQLAATGEMTDGRRGRPSRLFTHLN